MSDQSKRDELENRIQQRTAEPDRIKEALRSDITERKQATQALRESEAKFRSVFESIPLGMHMYTLEPDGRLVFTDANLAANKILGVDHQQFVGKTIEEAFPALTQTEVPEVYRLAAAEGIPWNTDQILYDEGEIAGAFEVHAFQTSPGQMVAVFLDITDRKRSQLALERRAAQLALLSDVGRQIAAELQLESVLDRAARLVHQGFDYHHVGLFTRDRKHGDMVMRAKAGEFVSLFAPNHRLKFGQGMVGWAAQHGETLLANDVDADPRYVNLYGDDVVPTRSELCVPIRVGTDIVGMLDVQSPSLNAFDENDVLVLETLADQIAVAIRNAQLYESMQESEERYRSFVQNFQGIAFRGTIDFVPLFFHGAVEQITGYTENEFLAGKPRWDQVIQPNDLARIAESVEGIRSIPGFEADREYSIVRKDGETRWLHELIQNICDDDGKPVFVQGAMYDVTARRQAEEKIRSLNVELEQRVIERTAQLEAANKELEAFTYSVSHDLRAPLRAMHGFSRILLQEFSAQLDSRAQHYLEMIHDNAKQMGQLIDDMLALSRLGRQALRKQPVLPATLVRQILRNLESEWEGRQVEITIGDPAADPDQALPPCQADPELLRQVFANLLSNAIKFTRQREVARIEVGYQEKDGQSIYFVRDNGVGFNIRYADKLFGVFQRLHRAEEYEGTGVGLAIVQRIVHRHGGRVWAEAEVDKGAVFFFTLKGESVHD